jgi:hypothetical protein
VNKTTINGLLRGANPQPRQGTYSPEERRTLHAAAELEDATKCRSLLALDLLLLDEGTP